MQLSPTTFSTRLSPGLQEAVFRHMIPLWLKRWPKAKTFQLALGNPLAPQLPAAALLEKLNRSLPITLENYVADRPPDTVILLGIGGTSEPTNKADIVVWGNAYNTSFHLGREFRTEYLRFGQQTSGQDSWRFLGERQSAIRGMAVLTIPQAGAQAVCSLDMRGEIDWFWRSPSELILVKDHYSKENKEIQRVHLPSGRVVKKHKFPYKKLAYPNQWEFCFSRFGKWFSYWEDWEGLKLIVASTDREEVRTIPIPWHRNALEKFLNDRLYWISDEECARIRLVGDQTQVIVYNFAKPVTEERTLIFDLKPFDYFPTGVSQTGELILAVINPDQTEDFVFLRMDTSAPSFRRCRLPVGSGVLGSICSQIGDSFAWVGDATSSDPNYMWKELRISGMEGQGMRKLASVAIPDNKISDAPSSPSLEPQWSPDGRYLGFIRDGIFWRLPV